MAYTFCQEMTFTRIAAVIIIGLTSPLYSSVPHALMVMLEGGGIAAHGMGWIRAGYVLSSTIASAALALALFRFKWNESGGFWRLFVLTVSAFGLYLVLSLASELVVATLVHGVPIEGEDELVREHPPLTPGLGGLMTSAVLYFFTYPLLVAVLYVLWCLEIRYVQRRQRQKAQQAGSSIGG